MNLRIPPLVITAIFLGLMYLIAQAVPVIYGSPDLRAVLGAISVAAGSLFCLLGIIGFRCARTTANPILLHKSTALVTDGIYAYSRNPMYLGFFFWLLGWGVYLGNPFALLFGLLFVPCLSRFQIRIEEAALRRLFGQAYDDYCAKVRRWL